MAASRSASASTTFADLPPSSSVNRFRLPAAARWISRPTSVEPVKETLSRSSCAAIAAPASASPVITFHTPAGTPASRASSARRSAETGASSAGLCTTAFPQASAGASFQEAMTRGKFHGVIAPTTPTGSRSVYENTPASAGFVVPVILVGQPA
jgi:hypothetical protein